MSDEKPREWWIETHEIMANKRPRHWPQVYENNIGRDTIHVIEKSAYDLLKEKLEAAEKRLRELELSPLGERLLTAQVELKFLKRTADELLCELTRERAINKIYEEALERYKHKLENAGAYIVEDHFEEPWHCELLRYVYEALSKAKGMRDGE
jgi:hypothetical protein